MGETPENKNTITKEQLCEGFRRVFGANPDTESASSFFIDRVWQAFDTSHDDQVNFKEFVIGISAFTKGSVEEKIRLAFEIYDIDDTGGISQEEMVQVLLSL